MRVLFRVRKRVSTFANPELTFSRIYIYSYFDSYFNILNVQLMGEHFCYSLYICNSDIESKKWIQ